LLSTLVHAYIALILTLLIDDVVVHLGCVHTATGCKLF